MVTAKGADISACASPVVGQDWGLMLAFVALGSNLGDSAQVLRAAMARLQALSDEPGLNSSLWPTDPVDCPPGSPRFLNAVAGLVPRTAETPESLLEKLQALEQEFGRQPKKIPNEPRPLDLDLIAFGKADAQHTTAHVASSTGASAGICA